MCTWPSSLFGISFPSCSSAVPIPVPSVVRITRPPRPCSTPYSSSATPAASASLTVSTSMPLRSRIAVRASMPSQRSEMWAEERTMPSRTIPGTPTPTGRSSSGVSSSTISAITSAMSSGSPPTGLPTVMRSVRRIPVVTSTMPALSVVPPMSMPRASRSRWASAAAAPSGAATRARSTGMKPAEARPPSAAGRGAVSGWGTEGPLGCGCVVRCADRGRPTGRRGSERAVRVDDPAGHAHGAHDREPHDRADRHGGQTGEGTRHPPSLGQPGGRVAAGPRPSIRPGTHRVG